MWVILARHCGLRCSHTAVAAHTLIHKYFRLCKENYCLNFKQSGLFVRYAARATLLFFYLLHEEIKTAKKNSVLRLEVSSQRCCTETNWMLRVSLERFIASYKADLCMMIRVVKSKAATIEIT